jgi:hypothetical protein
MQHHEPHDSRVWASNLLSAWVKDGTKPAEIAAKLQCSTSHLYRLRHGRAHSLSFDQLNLLRERERVAQDLQKMVDAAFDRFDATDREIRGRLAMQALETEHLRLKHEIGERASVSAFQQAMAETAPTPSVNPFSERCLAGAARAERKTSGHPAIDARATSGEPVLWPESPSPRTAPWYTRAWMRMRNWLL